MKPYSGSDDSSDIASYTANLLGLHLEINGKLAIATAQEEHLRFAVTRFFIIVRFFVRRSEPYALFERIV